jgi:hypothetical protein
VDAREKGLQRLATKGVVRLFNAIAKAQKQLREAEEATGSRSKAVKLGKASFLAQLKSSSGAAAAEALVPSAPARQGGAAAAAAAAAAGAKAGSKKQQQQQRRKAAAAAESGSEDEDAGGWDVLKQGFVGLQGEAGGRRSAAALWCAAVWAGTCLRAVHHLAPFKQSIDQPTHVAATLPFPQLEAR